MLNCFQLEGYLAAKPVEKQKELGTSMFTIIIASPRDPYGLSRKNVSDFVQLTAAPKWGEIILKHVKVGQHLVVRGHIRSYSFRTGTTRMSRQELMLDHPYFSSGDVVLTEEELEKLKDGREEKAAAESNSDAQEAQT